MWASVEIYHAEKVLENYPLERSGGMRQKVMIASNLFNSAMKVDLDEYLFDVSFDQSILEKAK